MKILMIYEFFYPETKYIAFALRGQAFAKYLTKLGVKVSVITPETKSMKNGIINYEGSQVYRIKLYNSFREKYSYLISWIYLPFSILRLIQETKKISPDLIITSVHSPFLGIEAAITAKCLSIPYIFDLQDSWLVLQYEHKGKTKTKIKMTIEKIVANYADLVFTVTPTLKNMLVNSYNINYDKVKVVYNGVDIQKFPVIKTTKEIDLIHLGAPKEYYDTFKLIDSFSIVVTKLPNANLIFLGCEDDEYTQKIKKYINDLGISQNVILMPPIPHSKVPYELSKAKIAVHSLIDLPVYKCAIGVKVFEYMALGLPIAHLGPNNSEEDRLINDNSIGVTSNNSPDYAEKLIYLLSNPEIREKMGENAIKTVHNYSWEKLVENTYMKHLRFLVRN